MLHVATPLGVIRQFSPKTPMSLARVSVGVLHALRRAEDKHHSDVQHKAAGRSAHDRGYIAINAFESGHK